MRFLLLFLTRLKADSPEGVDLSALGMSDFSPYNFDREFIWVLLPLLSLILVLLHLKQYNPLGRFHHWSPEEKNKTENS